MTIVNEKNVRNAQGQFKIKRHKESQEFVCDRCLNAKKAKVVVDWNNNGGKKVICNSCYGRLSSME